MAGKPVVRQNADAKKGEKRLEEAVEDLRRRLEGPG